MSKVNSFIEYWKEIQDLKKRCCEDEVLYFRGQYDVKFLLTPTAFRQKKKDEESRIYHETMVDYPEQFTRREHLSNLTKIQHYGGISRLLDITENPLSALYFAVEEGKNIDGRVFVFKVNKKDILHHTSDKALMLSCLPYFNDKDRQAIKDFVENNKDKIDDRKIKDNDVMIRFLHEIKSEFPAFEPAIIGEHLLKSYFVACYKDNERLKVQSGAFIIFGLDKTECTNRENEAIKIDIAAAAKPEILADLRLMGIDSSTVYPDFERGVFMKRLKYAKFTDIDS